MNVKPANKFQEYWNAQGTLLQIVEHIQYARNIYSNASRLCFDSDNLNSTKQLSNAYNGYQLYKIYASPIKSEQYKQKISNEKFFIL